MKQWFVEIIKWWKARVFNNLIHSARFIGTLVIPFCYGFIYLFAFWNPFSFSDKLNFALVNNDNTSFSKQIVDKFESSSSSLPFKIKFQNLTGAEFNAHKSDYYAAISIPNHFYQNLQSYFENPSPSNHPEIQFYFSYKKNFLVAESSKYLSDELHFLVNLAVINQTLTNFLVEIDNAKNINVILSIINDLKLLLGPFFATFLTLIEDILKIATGLPFPQIIHLLEKAVSDLLNEIKHFPPNKVFENLLNIVLVKKNIEGGNFSNYGAGLAPYFICIALWVGTLAQTFWLVSRKRIRIENNIIASGRKKGKWISKTWKQRMFNFSIVCINSMIISLLQSTILFISLTLLGFVVPHQIYLFLFAWLVSMSFSLIVFSIIFFFSYPDPGKFFVILFFIFQLVSCSATFPVIMEPAFFQFISNFLPFTYIVNVVRELMVKTHAGIVLWNSFFLVIVDIFFILLMMLISYFLIAVKYRIYNRQNTKMLLVKATEQQQKKIKHHNFPLPKSSSKIKLKKSQHRHDWHDKK